MQIVHKIAGFTAAEIETYNACSLVGSEALKTQIYFCKVRQMFDEGKNYNKRDEDEDEDEDEDVYPKSSMTAAELAGI